jgi:hypothetical protein
MTSAYIGAERELYPAGGVSPRTIADRAASMPIPATTLRPRIRMGRSRSGCVRRSRIAEANMQRYMDMYSSMEMSCSSAKAAEVFGANTETRHSTVTMVPWKKRIGMYMSLLVLWNSFGR